MRVTGAIFKKQLADTLKNKEVLIQFIMFPILTIIMNQAVKSGNMPLPHNYFVMLFSTMYVGMAPLTAMAAIIAEEKEKNTLRVLLMSDVKPMEYLAGVGGYIWGICMLGAMVFCVVGGYQGKEAAGFLMIMAVGILISILIGGAIGTASKSQMSATAVTVPVMMLFSFLPMLSMFNETIKKAANLTYSGQIYILVSELETTGASFSSVAVIFVNMVTALVVFWVIYRKGRLK